MDNIILHLAIEYASRFKGYFVDTDKHIITFPFPSGKNTDDIPGLMQPGSLCNWYADNGFNVSFTEKDVEYTIKAGTINKQAYLRNRLVATITW